MHPRPEWFNLLKCAVLKLIVCIGVMTFTYSGYLFPILLLQLQGCLPFHLMIVQMFSLVAVFVGWFACWLFVLALQLVLVKMEYKISCGIFAVANIMPSYWNIKLAVLSGPFGMGQFWDIVGQCYLWLLALLTGLLPIAMLLYCLALVWLAYEAQSSGGTATDGQSIVVVIPDESTTGATPDTRATSGSTAAPGSTAASSAT